MVAVHDPSLNMAKGNTLAPFSCPTTAEGSLRLGHSLHSVQNALFDCCQ